MKISRIVEQREEDIKSTSHLFDFEGGEFLIGLDMTDQDFNDLHMDEFHINLFDIDLPSGNYGPVKSNSDQHYERLYITKAKFMVDMIKDLARMWDEDPDDISEEFSTQLNYLSETPESYYAYWNHTSANIHGTQNALSIINSRLY